MLIFSLIVFSTAPFLYLFVNKIWQLAIVRFYHGFATAVFIPVAMALVADLFHHERGEKMGWFSTSTLIGRFIAPIAGGSIIGAMVFNPGLGYKIVYIVCGVAGIIALILTLKLPSESIPGKNLKMEDSVNRTKSPLRTKEIFTPFKSVLSNRPILITAGVESAILFAYGVFETFLPLYSIKIGLSAYEVGIFLSSQVITLALTKPLMGRFSDRHGRQPQIFWGAIISALCIGSFSFLNTFIPLLLLSILFGWSIAIVTSATSAYIADLSRQDSRGSAMGVLGSIMDIGHTAGPVISGILIANFGFKTAFTGATLILIILASMFLFFNLKKWE